jgi:hypothetical protein
MDQGQQTDLLPLLIILFVDFRSVFSSQGENNDDNFNARAD